MVGNFSFNAVVVNADIGADVLQSLCEFLRVVAGEHFSVDPRVLCPVRRAFIINPLVRRAVYELCRIAASGCKFVRYSQLVHHVNAGKLRYLVKRVVRHIAAVDRLVILNIPAVSAIVVGIACQVIESKLIEIQRAPLGLLLFRARENYFKALVVRVGVPGVYRRSVSVIQSHVILYAVLIGVLRDTADELISGDVLRVYADVRLGTCRINVIVRRVVGVRAVGVSPDAHFEVICRVDEVSIAFPREKALRLAGRGQVAAVRQGYRNELILHRGNTEVSLLRAVLAAVDEGHSRVAVVAVRVGDFLAQRARIGDIIAAVGIIVHFKPVVLCVYLIPAEGAECSFEPPRAHFRDRRRAVRELLSRL